MWKTISLDKVLFRGLRLHPESIERDRCVTFWFDEKHLAERCAKHPPRQLLTWRCNATIIDLTNGENISLLITIFSSGLPHKVAKEFINYVCSDARGSNLTFEDDFSHITKGLLPDGCVGYMRRTEFSTHSEVLCEFMVYKDFINQNSTTITDL